MRAIGQRTPSVDWQAMTSGSLRYTADVDLPGVLTAAVVRSPLAHARIVGVDTAAARSIPGVRAVLTAADLPDRRYIDYRPQDADRYPLARGVVRHVGEPVAIVAADDEATARRAVEAVRVRYRRLPVLEEVQQSVRSGRVAIHDGHPDNVAKRVHREFGDRQQAAARTATRVRHRYVSSRQSHATMEPHTVMADWHADEGVLQVWAPSQGPRTVRRDIAQIFDLPLDRVVMNEVAVGGDFGGRTHISSTEVLAAALSMATGRPVRLAQTRAEEFAFTKSRLRWDLDLELGCDDQGRVTFLDAGFDVDNGAYNQAGPGEMDYGSVALGSTYRWLSYTADGRCVYTNKQSSSSFRGAGGFAVSWAIECAIDELAEAAGQDPIDFRLKNAVSQVGETSLTGWQVKSSRLADCLETVRREIDWDAKRKAGGQGRGVGVACSMHVTALRREPMLRSSAAVDVYADGSVRVRSGLGDAGTGQKTLQCQAVAEVLDIDLAQVGILSTHTGQTPHDAGAGASRGSFHSVSAVRLAAEAVREELTRVAAEKFGVEPGEVRWEGGAAVFGPDRLDRGDLAALAVGVDDLPFSVEREFTGDWNDVKDYGYEDVAPTYSFAAQAVEVEVDQTTGAIRVLDVVAAHDSGTVLNPLSARGQVEGGVLMGLGAALGEELITEGGRVVNGAYVDYLLPRSAEAPNVTTVFLESKDPEGPFGAKGLGEIPLLPVGAALANAVAHAVGVRLREAPFTPDKVLAALRERDGRPQKAGKVRWTPQWWWVEGMRRSYPLGVHAALERYVAKLKPTRRQQPVEDLVQPASDEEALHALAAPGAAPLGGGTDLMALRAQGLPTPTTLVDVTTSRELTRVVSTEDGLSIGAAVTLAQLVADPQVDDVIRHAAEQIATPQIRQAATVAGNLCQAKRCWFYRNGFDCYKRSGATRPCYAIMGDHRFYHAVEGGHRCQAVTPSDLATVLLALDCQVDIARDGASRRTTIDGLYRGPGETTLADGELVTRLLVPAPARARTTRYRKLALWQGGFAVASVAISCARSGGGELSDVRVVLGSVGPTPRRVAEVENLLEGAVPTDRRLRSCAQAWLDGTHPLPHNHWKAHATANLLTATLHDLILGSDRTLQDGDRLLEGGDR